MKAQKRKKTAMVPDPVRSLIRQHCPPDGPPEFDDLLNIVSGLQTLYQRCKHLDILKITEMNGQDLNPPFRQCKLCGVVLP